MNYCANRIVIPVRRLLDARQGLEFDYKERNKLFDKGYSSAVYGNYWKTAPPERGPGERLHPLRYCGKVAAR